MTLHSARTIREVSETAVIYTFLYFWKKHLVQIPWKGHFKVENLVFYKHETGVLFVEGFAEGSFFPFKHKVV